VHIATEEESRLVARSRQGDLEAFNSLVEMFQGAAYNLCLRLLGSPEAAEDATQEAFLSAFRHIADFRGANFRSWLLRIAANAATDELRRRRRRPQIPLETVPGEEGPVYLVPDSSPGPEAVAVRREALRQVEVGLLTLPIDQRSAVVLSDVQGLSYEEVAQATGASLGTVKSRISRGRERLRRHLSERGTFGSGAASL
jgi:RNA polymerase sigma-70 factor (ECF subfamily)